LIYIGIFTVDEPRTKDPRTARKVARSRGGVLIGFESDESWFDTWLERNPHLLRHVAQERSSLRVEKSVTLEDLEPEQQRTVKLPVADGRLTSSVTNPDSGSAAEELDADYESAPLEIDFNARYLLDIMAQFDGGAALLEFVDPGSPTLVRDKESAAALFVLMPMRVLGWAPA